MSDDDLIMYAAVLYYETHRYGVDPGTKRLLPVEFDRLTQILIARGEIDDDNDGPHVLTFEDPTGETVVTCHHADDGQVYTGFAAGKPVRVTVVDDTEWIDDYAADMHIELDRPAADDLTPEIISNDERLARLRKTGLGMGSLHADIFQRYYGEYFWTVCECGLQFSGADPDEADTNHMNHREANEKADQK